MAPVQTNVCDDPASEEPAAGDVSCGAAAAALVPRTHSSRSAAGTRVLFMFTTRHGGMEMVATWITTCRDDQSMRRRPRYRDETAASSRGAPGLRPGGRFRTPIGVTISGVKRVPVLAGVLAIGWVALIAAQTGGAAKPAPKPAVVPAPKGAATPAAKPPVQVAAAVPAPATMGSPAAARALVAIAELLLIPVGLAIAAGLGCGFYGL